MKLLDLVVDYQKISEEELADLLQGIVIFDKETYEPKIIVKESMSPDVKILISLAAYRGQAMLSQKEKTVMPKDIEVVTRLKGGTVRPRLRYLFDSGYVLRLRDGGYALSDNGLRMLHDFKPTKGGE